MEISSTYNYSPPVDQLLTYGEAEVVEAKDWPDYLELGFGPEHAPELIRMVINEQLNRPNSENLNVWPAIHAWRALGQLHAEAAIEPLLSLFDPMEHSGWVTEEVPDVLGMIGPAALPILAAYIADDSHHEWARVTAVDCVEKIEEYSPEARSACVEILSKQLEQFQKTDYELNAALIRSLVDLKVVEAAPLMKRAWDADAVEPFLMGDWEGIEEALGLLSPEELEQLQQRRLERQNALFSSSPFSQQDVEYSASGSHGRGTANKKARHKNKVAKQSRKKNRKR